MILHVLNDVIEIVMKISFESGTKNDRE